jgi:4a-hydroxytetrahydrobiopterin dehydratase
LLNSAPGTRQVTEDAAGCLRLQRALKTKNFLKALEACNRVGEAAERLKHHPDMHVTDWNRLAIEVWSHEAGGVTQKDLDLAAAIDAVDVADLLSKKQD